jgi:hypothetical protein
MHAHSQLLQVCRGRIVGRAAHTSADQFDYGFLLSCGEYSTFGGETNKGKER